jgi:hypothetical protein
VKRDKQPPSRQAATREGPEVVHLLLAALPLLILSCGSSAPVGGSFTVDFPTVADAVATDTVQIFAYTYGTSTTCQALFEARRTTQMSPQGDVAETQTTSPCALSRGMGTLSLPFGNYSFLAVGQAMGADLFLGCAAQTISDTNSVVSIPLTLETDMTAVPATTCASLSSFCAMQCK